MWGHASNIHDTFAVAIKDNKIVVICHWIQQFAYAHYAEEAMKESDASFGLGNKVVFKSSKWKYLSSCLSENTLSIYTVSCHIL